MPFFIYNCNDCNACNACNACNLIQAYCFRFYFLLVTVIIFDGMVMVQRTEYWELSLPCKRIREYKKGIDNLNVLRGVAKLIAQEVAGTPLSLFKDGDLFATINSMLCLRGVDTVQGFQG